MMAAFHVLIQSVRVQFCYPFKGAIEEGFVIRIRNDVKVAGRSLCAAGKGGVQSDREIHGSPACAPSLV
jgi:hypothetical protein